MSTKNINFLSPPDFNGASPSSPSAGFTESSILYRRHFCARKPGGRKRFFKNYFILDISTPRSRVNYKTNHLYSIQCNTTQGLKDLMRERGRVAEGQRHVLPPQIFNGEQYRGVGFSFPQNLHFSPHDYDGFDLLRFRTMMGLIWQMRTMCWRNFLALTGNIPKWVFLSL